MITDQQFKQAAALLKRSSPVDAWDNFVGALEAYTYVKIGECVDAPLDSVVVRQGFARQCKKLLQLLQECEKTPPASGGTS
jgi:hypothetical protein